MSDIVERLRTRPTGDPYLHMMVHEAADEIERLRAEAAGLREDAERYRWLRSGTGEPGVVIDYGWCEYIEFLNGSELDAAIDAARKGEA